VFEELMQMRAEVADFLDSRSEAYADFAGEAQDGSMEQFVDSLVSVALAEKRIRFEKDVQLSQPIIEEFKFLISSSLDDAEAFWVDKLVHICSAV
jgi:hypothetical protein